MAINDNGDVYLSSGFTDTADFDPGPGIAKLGAKGPVDIFIAKYSENGNFLWVKGIGSTGADASLDIKVDLLGNIFVTGFFEDTVDFDPGPSSAPLIAHKNVWSDRDIFLAKYDSNGNYLWAVGFGGASGEEQGTAISVDSNGDVYVTGVFGDTIDLNPGIGSAVYTAPTYQTDVFLVKFDRSGNYLWSSTLGGPSWNRSECVISDVTTDRVYLTGYFQDTATFDPGVSGIGTLVSDGQSAFLAAYDMAGVIQWVHNFKGSSSGESMAVDDYGNVVVTGHFRDTIDFDFGPGVASLVSDPSGNDIFLAKYDLNGTYLWAKKMGGPGNGDVGYGVKVDKSNNIYLTGSFVENTDFDPGLGQAMLSTLPFTRTDMFLAKYDGGGNYLDAFSMPDLRYDGFDRGTGLEIYEKGNLSKVYLAGMFSYAVDFQPGADSLVLNTGNYSGSGSRQMFISVYSPPCSNVSGPTLLAGLCPEDTLVYGNLTITSPGNYTAAFPAGNGCDSLVDITVSNVPAHTVSTTASICSGEMYVFDTLQLTTSGTYTQVFKNQHGCDSAVTLILTVNEIDTSTYITNVHTLNVNQGFAAYQWVDCDANYTPISGATNQSFTATENGNYAVIVTTADGCTDTSECRAITIVGIEEIPGVGSIQLYPNPAAGTVYLEISTDNPMDLNLHLQDSRGRLVYERVLGQVAGAHTYELPLDGLASGVYHVVVQGDDGMSVRKLVVIE